jgi:hypothetical protein
MSEIEVQDKLEKVCTEAHQKLEQLGKEEYSELLAKLAWCLGSYRFDKNPAGLVAAATEALEVLKAIKNEKPRLVAKKLIEDLEKAVA